MNSNETRTLWISIGAALLAVFLLYSHSQETKKEYINKYGNVKTIVVAAEDIAEMQTINETMLEVKERPTEFIDPSAISSPEDAVGQVAGAPIKKGEQILSNKLLAPGPNTGIALQVAPQKRAIAIPVDEIRAVSKLIRPGDRIDLMAVLETGSGNAKVREAKTILQDVAVLATGENVVNDIPRLYDGDTDPKHPSWVRLKGDTKYTTISVEVTPEEAQNLAFILATAPGSLYMSLRNPNDKYLPPTRITTMETVLGKPDLASINDSLRRPAEVRPVATPAPTPVPRVAPKPKSRWRPL